MGRPRKIQWPIKVEELLRIHLREKRPEDRWKIFKEWLRWRFGKQFGRDPSAEELNGEIEKWRSADIFDSNGIHNSMYVLRHDFMPEYYRENRINKARLAAKQRWINQRSKKQK